MVSWRKREPAPSDPTVASYYYQTAQIKDMKWVLSIAIVAGTLLMMISVISPFVIVALINADLLHVINPATHPSTKSQLNATSVASLSQTLASTPKEVLPFATALAGFAGGVVTAMFRASTQPPAGQPPAGHARPTANNINVHTNRNTQIQITLAGTSSIPGDVLKFFLVANPQHGTVTLGAVSNIVTYTPQADYTGDDRFAYKVTDGRGLDSDPATVTIAVT